MTATKSCVLWNNLGLLVRIISAKDPLSDMKQVDSLTRLLNLKTPNRSDK